MWWKGVFLNHLFFFLPASSLYAKLMLIASWLQLHGQRAETWKCCWSSHLTLGKKKRASQFFFFFFYQTISSKQEDFITMSTQQWLACCPCKHTVEHTPAAGERWRRTELWGRGQGKPSKSDLLYLHPGSLSLNISVRVCTRNRGGGGVGEMREQKTCRGSALERTVADSQRRWQRRRQWQFARSADVRLTRWLLMQGKLCLFMGCNFPRISPCCQLQCLHHR